MKPVIIYPPTIDWDYLHQRPQQLFKALSSLGCTCVFCNHNLHKRHIGKFTFLNPNLLLANQQSVLTAIAYVRQNYPGRPVVLYFTYPPHIRQLPPVDLVVFDSVDEPANEFSDWLPAYAAAIQQADIVIATAQSLADRAGKLREAVHLINNGCDYEHFAAAQVQQPLSELPFQQNKPVIGYIGAIAPWVDMKLINTMARHLPEFNFVLIGPLLKQNWLALPNNNMTYLGHKDYTVLPGYLSNFSYCLIPFQLTEMTKGVNPVKFWEYLASGIPILSTPLPEIPRDYVTTVTLEMFPGFRPSPSAKGREERIRFAVENSWHKKASNLLALIEGKLRFG